MKKECSPTLVNFIANSFGRNLDQIGDIVSDNFIEPNFGKFFCVESLGIPDNHSVSDLEYVEKFEKGIVHKNDRFWSESSTKVPEPKTKLGQFLVILKDFIGFITNFYHFLSLAKFKHNSCRIIAGFMQDSCKILGGLLQHSCRIFA